MTQRRTIADIGASAPTARRKAVPATKPHSSRIEPTLDAVDSDIMDVHTRVDRDGSAHTRTPAARRGKTQTGPAAMRSGRFALFVAVALEASIAAIWLLVGSQALGMPGLALLLGLHGVAALLAVLAWRALARHQRLAEPGERSQSTGLRLVALGVFTLGPLGVLGALGALLLKRRLDRRGVAQDARWLSMISPTPPHGTNGARRANGTPGDGREALRPQEDPAICAALEERPSVSPFADILAHGSVAQRQAVVSTIAANYQPAFAPSLHRALRDTDTSVRMMAAAAIERLETRHLETSMACESAWARSPEDPIAALRLAQHYDNYANSGLVDQDRARRALERALEMYELAGERRPDDPLIAQSVLRVLTRLHREDEALDRFGPILEAGAAPATMASWLLECLFRRRRYKELRKHAHALMGHERDFDTLTKDAQQAAGLWSSDATAGRDLAEVGLQADTTRARGRRHAGFGPLGEAPVIDVPYFSPRWSR